MGKEETTILVCFYQKYILFRDKNLAYKIITYANATFYYGFKIVIY